jgi:magnesium-transporting ATPase (P-type)
MVGGTILVLPLLGLHTGYMVIPGVTLLIALIAFYTCYLIVLHLGESRNIKEVILQHFNNRFSALVIYNFIIAISLVGVIINYYQLIIKQVEGFMNPSIYIGIAVFAILLILTIIMRYLNFGEKLLAIGIFSIVAYLTFLTWAQITAEHTPNKVPATGPKYTDLASSLVMGLSIHDFVVQILFKTT